jgi:diguanylate cyclase (GGDEF)-like protein/PAS domain S-box-containing protein
MDDGNPVGFAAPLPDAIRARRVAALYRQAIPGFLVTLTVAAVCTAMLWAAVDRGPLAAWFLAVAAITAARYVLARRYHAAAPPPQQAGRWENAFVVGAGAMGVAWGSLAALINPASYTLQLFVAFAIGGMVIGGMAVLSASQRAFYWFALPMLGAQIAEFLLLGGDLYPAMGVLGLIFLAAALRLYANLHRTVVQGIEQGLVNERLLAEQRGLLDAATVGIVFLRDRKVVDCNVQFARIVGWTRAELIGGSSRLWFPDEASWTLVLAESEARLAAGQPHRTELELKRQDGERVWCDTSWQAVIARRPDLGIVAVYADITERKRTSAALRASEERLELAIQASQSGLWDWDVVNNVQHVSDRFREILGLPHDVDLGRMFHLPDRLHPDDRGRVLAAVDATVNTGAPFDQEARLRRADGSYVWAQAKGHAVRDARGRAVRFVGSIIDISDRKRVEERLRESESHFRHLVETANDLVWAVDRDGRWTYLSPRAARQIFGCEPEDMLRERLVESQPERERERTHAMLTRVLADGTASHFETVHVDRKGREAVLSLNATPLRGPGGTIVGVTGTATDITELKRKEAQLSAALAEQQLLFDSVSEGIVLLRNGLVHKCNAKFAAMLGYAPAELAGQPSLVWYADPTEWEHVGRTARLTLAQGRDHGGELLVKRKDGSQFWCDMRGRALDPQRVDDGAIFVFIDISARKEREQRIQHLADHDALTGLLNRRLLEDRLQQSISLARRNDSMVAVMLIDLDGFKAVNDQYGHLMGDYVLRTVAKRLKDCVRESDTIARLGGDEFVVLLSGQRSAEDSSVVAGKILTALTEPVAAGGRRFDVGASIGISIFPRDGTSPEQLLKHADAAMYRVKEAGKNRYEFYSTSR